MIIIRIGRDKADLVFDLFDKYRVFYGYPPDIETARKFIQERLDGDESVIFVALDPGTGNPVGFTQLYPKYSSVRAIKSWILNDLYVDITYRKQGIGEALIKKAMDFARQTRSDFVELSTAVDNYTAQSLYERIGFKRMAPETDFYTYRIDLTE